MVFHSIIPLEIIFQEESKEQANFITDIIMYNGCQVEVMASNNSLPQIRRLHSTSLKDYLNPKLQPGTILDRFGQ